MPQWNFESRYPCPDSPEQGMANLAMAVLVGLVDDLQAPNPKRRSEAQAAVWAQVPEAWMSLLDLTEDQCRRVRCLLHELAH